MIGELLAGDAPRADAPRYAGLPRSTYVVARRRVFRDHWVYDRYVPNPALLGFRRVRLQLARPFAEGLHELSVRWRTDPGAVLLWRHPNLLFGVFFDRTDEIPRLASGDPTESSLASTSHVVQGDPRGPLLPVYFDHEGAWSRWTRTAGTAAFPRSLGGTPPASSARDRLRAHPAFLPMVRELLARTPAMAENDAGRPLHLRGTFGLSRSRLRLLELGFVQRRVFVDFARLPPFEGRTVDQLLLLHGRLLPSSSPELLFRDIVADAGVNPFLLAADGSSVVVGAFSGSPEGASERRGGVRVRPLEVLQRHLRELDPFWSDLRGLDVLLDHTYDRLQVPEAPREGGHRS